MAELNPRIRTLLRQAQRTAEAGKRTVAEKLYRELVAEFPEVAEGWLGLAGVVRDSAESRQLYERTLELDPDNAMAQAALRGDPVAVPADPPPILPAPPPPPTPESAPEPAPAAVEGVLHCANHPKTVTTLRCNKCGRPMCSRCVIYTPVGYRCKECVRDAEATFFNATALDYFLAVLVTLPLSIVVGFLADRLGFFVIFLAAAAGTGLGAIAFRLASRRRGRYLPATVAATVALGGLIGGLLPNLLVWLNGGGFSFGLLSLLWPAVYIFIATSAAYYRLR